MRARVGAEPEDEKAEKGRVRSLRSPSGAAHSEGATSDAALDWHPSSIGTGRRVSKVNDQRDDIWRTRLAQEVLA
jgi:hypothetical protein